MRIRTQVCFSATNLPHNQNWKTQCFSCLDISKTGKRRSVEQSLRSMVLLIKAERCFEGFVMFSNTLIVFRKWLKELFWFLMSWHKKWNQAWRGGCGPDLANFFLWIMLSSIDRYIYKYKCQNELCFLPFFGENVTFSCLDICAWRLTKWVIYEMWQVVSIK